MAWFLRLIKRPGDHVPNEHHLPTLEECRDDSARARLADDIDEGSFTMEEDETSAHGSEKEGKQSHKSCFFRMKSFFRTIYKVVSSVVGLLVLLVAYSFLGAAIFRAIEGPPEKTHKDNITSNREEIIEVLQGLSSNFSKGVINITQWNETTTRLLLAYEGAILSASENGVTNSTSDPKWTFWGSMFFCGTIYTTIGYGHIVPSTDWGRVITMIYAAIGIPLALVCLADLGKYITLGLKFIWAFCRRYCNCCKKAKERKANGYTVNDVETVVIKKKPGDRVFCGYKIDDEFNIPIYVAIAILGIYLFVGSIMYTLWEEWSFLESFYFVFISVSTIGFGDILPAHPKFFLLSSLYVFFGLSLVSMCVNVAIEFFSKTIDKAKVNLDRAKTKAREKAKEAKETMERATHRAKERVSDFKKRSVRDRSQRSPSGTPRHTPSSDDVVSMSDGHCTPVLEEEEANTVAKT